MKQLIFTATVFCFSIYSFAQNSKHMVTSGKVIFDIFYPDLKADQKTKESLPKETILTFNSEKIKVEVNIPYSKTTIISDNSGYEAIMLMEVMGKKWEILMDKNDMNKQRANTSRPQIVLTRESKMIAGYYCTKALVGMNFNNSDNTFEVWYTNQIKAKNSFSSQIEGINGFLMEYYSMEDGKRVKMVARKVEQLEVPDSEFLVPEGFEKKTFKELKAIGELK